MNGVVNSVAYSGGLRIGEVAISDISEVKRAVVPLVDICNRLVRADVTTALEANLSLISVSQNEDMKRLAGWALRLPGRDGHHVRGLRVPLRSLQALRLAPSRLTAGAVRGCPR